jgi:hypothetical protein
MTGGPRGGSNHPTQITHHEDFQSNPRTWDPPFDKTKPMISARPPIETKPTTFAAYSRSQTKPTPSAWPSSIGRDESTRRSQSSVADAWKIEAKGVNLGSPPGRGRRSMAR